MMGGVLPETCWAIKKHWNNNSTTWLHLVGSFYEFYQVQSMLFSQDEKTA